MIMSAVNTNTFFQGIGAYRRTRRLGRLMCGGLFVCMCITLFLSFKLLGSYTHVFTPYLKWQDALVALLWYIAVLGLEGSILILCFLRAVRTGYKKGVFSLIDETHVAVRDLSSENLASIFWMLNASFWCFVVVLIGLVPVILVGWTIHISNPTLAVLATGLAILLSLAGLVVSVVAASFIVIGCFGAVSYARKLGSTHVYPLDSQATIRLDGTVLTFIYPDTPESMLDLQLLDAVDQQRLVALLRERWQSSESRWILELGENESAMPEDAEAMALLVP